MCAGVSALWTCAAWKCEPSPPTPSSLQPAALVPFLASPRIPWCVPAPRNQRSISKDAITPTASSFRCTQPQFRARTNFDLCRNRRAARAVGYGCRKLQAIRAIRNRFLKASAGIFWRSGTRSTATWFRAMSPPAPYSKSFMNTTSASMASRWYIST